MRILITGGYGYLGSRIADFFLKNTNHEIVIASRRNKSINNDIDQTEHQFVLFIRHQLCFKIEQSELNQSLIFALIIVTERVLALFCCHSGQRVSADPESSDFKYFLDTG